MKKFKLLFTTIIITGTIIIMACANGNNLKQANEKEEKNVKALNLLQSKCFACHNPDLDIETRIAPPMFKVRDHYFDSTIKKEDFIKSIVLFASNPLEENSNMPGAIRNFGLMPKQIFKEEDLKTIAEYIYENDLESDEWYAKWEQFKKISKTSSVSTNYEEMGMNYASQTKTELGKNLLGAINKLGTANALEFCNTRAIPITDSMANVLKVSIKRVSDKPRNTNNKANESELLYINELKNNIQKGIKTNPKMMEINGKMVGYYAIETNKMCLQCHGNSDKDILPETQKKIKKLYPNDKAIGYGENEIRGIWVVEMAKK
ncbi:MAG: Tll0287-like domain-containing protein [Bacteroidia bacterium]